MRRREILAGGLAATAVPASAAVLPQAQPVRLDGDGWAIDIDPATLALTVHIGGKSVPVSSGVAGHRMSALARTADGLSWTWDDRFDFACSLAGADLAIRVAARGEATLALLDQPPQALGRGMMLPIGEGHYVPAEDAGWRTYLIERKSPLSAHEDMSLPLWGLDHDGFTLHWLLTNPFNTEISFRAGEGGLHVGLEHSFTRLAPDAPMTLVLHRGGADLLAGAKRYRRYLTDTGKRSTLAEKIARTPSAERLIGATHVYLWATGLIGEKDVADWPAFAAALKGPSTLAAALRGGFEEAPELLAGPVTRSPPPWQRRQLIRAFNGALDALARARWQPNPVDSAALLAAYADLRADVVQTFGEALAPDPAGWGEGLSKATIARLREAGLERLWIGLGSGWEGGLWHPGAVQAAAEAGYLIAPYDSYETAVEPGKRPDWATAQLGREAWQGCAIVQRDGKLRPGFGREGHYTNTLCVTPILKDRVPAIAKAAGFNSWFLDVYATGMVFDDYRPGRPSSKAQQAEANIAACRWVSEHLQLPTGSEDGRAVGAEGVFFAHGLQTPVMGWGDPDLQKNKDSPFFLGGWYPPEAPASFFRQVPLKEPYRTIHLSPGTRLPLHQAVFHGSMIASHHWLYDQLKFSNALADRAIAQQLYNVPALFHINADSLAERLPVLLRNHAFFSRVHQRLANQTLDSFEWLTPDRLVQQTGFADGTRLIANFDTKARRAGALDLPPQSVTATGIGDEPLVFTAQAR